MWQTNYMDPELLQYILNNIQKGNSNQMSQIEPLTGMYRGSANLAQDTPFVPQGQSMQLPSQQINPFGSPQSYKSAEVDTGVAYQQNKDAQMSMQKSMYDKAMMEQYLNNQAFGAGSQVTGTMPYYADRMGRGIQSGNIGQAIGGGLGFLFQGAKSAFAGAGQQKTEDFLRTEGQQKMREYMKAGKGRESLYGNYAMGYSGNFAEGGEMPMEEQMPMEQEIPQEQMQQMPQGEDVIFAYFEANQFNEQQAQEFMQYFQSLAPEEQQAAIQEMAAALSPQQGEQPEQEEMEEEKEEPTILDGKTMSESTKVVRKGKKDFLQIIQETPISKKEAKDFRKFM